MLACANLRRSSTPWTRSLSQHRQSQTAGSRRCGLSHGIAAEAGIGGRGLAGVFLARGFEGCEEDHDAAARGVCGGKGGAAGTRSDSASRAGAAPRRTGVVAGAGGATRGDAPRGRGSLSRADSKESSRQGGASLGADSAGGGRGNAEAQCGLRGSAAAARWRWEGGVNVAWLARISVQAPAGESRRMARNEIWRLKRRFVVTSLPLHTRARQDRWRKAITPH